MFIKWIVLLVVIVGCVAEDLTDHDETAYIQDLQKQAVRDGTFPRIVAGWPAVDGQFPHQVNLKSITSRGDISNCGGSIIHHTWVITAGHCLANRYHHVVRIGLTNLTTPEYMIEASRRHFHPDFKETITSAQSNDIALLGLDTWIPYGPHIQPCRLQSSEQKDLDYTGVRLVATGYGYTDDWQNGGVLSEVLRWVYLRGISFQECRDWFPTSLAIAHTTICAGSYNDTEQAVCNGDSGGPLTVLDYDYRPTMVGIVSFGSTQGCNSPWPAAYVRPGHYHDWFRDVTGINFDWTINYIGS